MNAIVCTDLDWGIGYKNNLLDRIPEDLKRFKSLTEGKVVIMGRNTYESIGHTLPNRINIILSTSMVKENDDTIIKNPTNTLSLINLSESMKNAPIVFDNIDEVLEFIEMMKFEDDDIFVIGGESIYRQLMYRITRIYLTQIQLRYEDVDTYFPMDEDTINKFVWDTGKESSFIKDNKVIKFKYLTYYKRENYIYKNKIFVIMGKSSSGKDTVFKMLKNGVIDIGDHYTSTILKPVLLYTTRQPRSNEKDGVRYHFTTEREYLETYSNEPNRLVFSKAYHPKDLNGDMQLKRYFLDSKDIDISKDSYVIIGTIDYLNDLRKFYGEDRIVPIYIDIDDDTRFLRAVEREKSEEKPNYGELCRRFTADNEQYNNKRITTEGINYKIENYDLETCVKQITEIVRRELF